MMNRPDTRSTALTCLLVGAMAMTSCNKEEEQQASQTPTANQTPMATQPQPLRPDELNLAAGAQFPAELVPVDDDSARAVAALASAFATGDAETLRSMLDRSDVGVLEHLIETGDWRESTAATDVVRVCAVEEVDNGVRVGLGLEDEEGAYLLGFEGRQARGDWNFSALPVESPPASRATELDGASLQ